MRTLSDTSLETFQFGSNPEDKYYLLIDLVQNSNGIDLAKLANADPRSFDTVLSDMGCLLMLSGDEIQELVLRQAVDEQNLHESLFNLARHQGII